MEQENLGLEILEKAQVFSRALGKLAYLEKEVSNTCKMLNRFSFGCVKKRLVFRLLNSDLFLCMPEIFNVTGVPNYHSQEIVLLMIW